MTVYYSDFFPSEDSVGVLGTTVPALTTARVQEIFADLDSALDDSVLTVDEKIRIIVPLNNELEIRYNGLITHAVTLNVSTDALTAARSAWITYRNSLNPAWNSTVDDTTGIDRATFEGKVNDFISAIQALENTLNAAAATRADIASGLTNGGVPVTPAQIITAQGTSANTTNVGTRTALTVNDVLDGLVTSVGTLQPDTIAPDKVLNLSLTSGIVINSDGSQIVKVYVTWTASSATDLAGYELEIWALNGGHITTVLGSNTNHYDFIGTTNTNYYAIIRAFDTSHNMSINSTQATVLSASDTSIPGDPYSVVISASLGSIFIRWINPNDSDLKGTQIWASTDSNINNKQYRTTVNAIAGAIGSYNEAASTGTIYYYWLRSVDSSSNVGTNFVGPYSQQVPSVVATDFTPGLQAIQTVNSPSLAIYTTVAWNGSTIIFNQADGKTYKYVGTSPMGHFEPVVNTTDLSGTVGAEQIAGLDAAKIISGAFGPNQIAPAAITASKIAAGLTLPQDVNKVNINDGSVAGYAGGLAYNRYNGKMYRWDTSTSLWKTVSVDTSTLSGILTSEQIDSVVSTKITGVLSTVNIPGLDASKIVTGQFGTTQISDAAITAAKFASGLTVPRQFGGTNINDGSFPGYDGDLAYSTNTNQLYRCVPGGTWVSVYTPASAIQGQLTSAQIVSITAAQISTTLTAGQIPGLDASKISSGNFTGAYIAANTIDASKIQPGYNLPQSYNVANMNDGNQISPFGAAIAFNLYDGKMYQNRDGTNAYTLAHSWFPMSVGSGDIVGTLTSDQVASIVATKVTGTLSTVNIPGLSASQIISGTFDGSRLADGVITASKINTTLKVPRAFGGTNINDGSFPGVDGDLAYSTNANQMYRCIPDGTWVAIYTPAGAVTGTLTNAQIASITASKISDVLAVGQIPGLDASKITSGSFTGAYIAANTIDASRIVAGYNLPATYAVANMNDGNQTAPFGGALAYNIPDGKMYRNYDGTNSYTLAHAWAPIVSDAAYVSGQLTSDQISSIVAGKVTGVLGTANIPGLDAGQIVSGTFGTTRIADAALTASKFADGLSPVQRVGSLPGSGSVGQVVFLTGDSKLYRWVAGIGWVKNVDGGDIIAGTIYGDRLVAGTIQAAQIGVGQITASKLLVQADGLNPDPYFNDHSFWTADHWYYETGVAVQARTGANTGITLYDGAGNGTSGNTGLMQIISQPIPIRAGLDIELQASVFNASNKTLVVDLQILDTAGAYVVGTGDISIAANQGGVFRNTVVLPSSAAFYQVLVYVVPGAPFVGLITLSGIQLRERAGGTMIIDGAVVASKIAAGAIIAGKIAAGVITATEIASDAITAVKVQAGAISASKLNVTDLLASNIGVQIIQAGTLTADKIVVGSIGAAQIAAGSITASKLVVQPNNLSRDPYIQDPAMWVNDQGSYSPISPYAIWYSEGTGGGSTALGVPNSVTLYSARTGWDLSSRRALYQNWDGVAATMPQYLTQVTGNTVYEMGAVAGQFSNQSLHVQLDLFNNAGSTVQQVGFIVPPSSGGFSTPRYQFTTAASVSFARWVIYNDGGTVFSGVLRASGLLLREAATATMIVDGSIVAGKVAANAISAANIVAGSIGTDQLAANAVTATTILAGAVTALKLNVGDLLANNIGAQTIQAGTLSADRLAANSITATQIAAGTITGTQIAAGAITAAKLAVGSFDNVIKDGSFVNSDLSGWSRLMAYAGDTVYVSNANNPGWPSPVGLRLGRYHASSDELSIVADTHSWDDAGNYGITVQTGDQFLLSTVTYTEGAGSPYVDMIVKQQDGTIVGVGGSGPTGSFISQNIILTAPATGRAFLRLYCGWTGTMGAVGDAVWYWNVLLRRRNTGLLIVDGAIAANQLAVGAVVAGKIAAGVITSTEIATDAITATKVQAGSISASKLNVTDLYANNIGVSIIQANTLNADRIIAGTIGAAQIAAGSITASKLTLTDTSNLILDGQIIDPSYWSLESGGPSNYSLVYNDAAFPSWQCKGAFHVLASTETHIKGGWISASTGDAFYISGRTYLSAAGTSELYVLATANDGTNPIYTQIQPTTVSGSWQQLGGAYTLPAGVGRFALLFVARSSSTGFTEFSAPVVRKMANAQLIVDGSIVAGKIAANAVAATNILAGAIGTDQLAANAVTAVKIVAGAIGVDQLAANAVTAVKIAASSITGDRIAGSTISGDNIIAGTLTAAQLAAGSITASKLVLTDMSNLILDAQVLDPSYWQTLNGSSANWSLTGEYDPAFSAWQSKGAITVTGGETYVRSAWMQATVGDAFLITGRGYLAAAGSAELYVYQTAADGSAGAFTFIGQTTTVGYWYSMSGPWTVPSGFGRFALVFVSRASNAGASQFAGPIVRKMANASLIVDGSVTATAIAARTILATNIVAGTLTSTEIAARTITGTNIVAGTLTANEVAARSLTADRIVANSLTSNEILATSITADRLVTGSITSTQIAAGSITASRLTLIGTDLITDPLFYDTNSIWYLQNGIYVEPGTPGTSTMGLGASRGLVWQSGVLTTANRSYAYYDFRPTTLIADQTVRFKATCSNQSNHNHHVDFNVADSSGNNITGVGITWVPGEVAVKEASFVVPANASGQLRVICYNQGADSGGPATYSGYATVVGLSAVVAASANMIVDGAIVANKIATSAVTATKINVDDLYANNIGVKIIQVGTLNADAIVSGTIQAAQIASGAISAEKLSIGSQDNLIPNPNSEDTTATGLAALYVSSVPWAYNGGYVRYLYGTGGGTAPAITDYIAAQPGEQFYFSGMAQTGPNGVARLLIEFLNSAKSHISYHYDIAGSVTQVVGASTPWTALYSTTTPAPAGTSYVRFVLYCERNVASGDCDCGFDALYARRMMKGQLVVDGTITATQIAAGTITSDRIQAGSIAGDRISSSTSLPGTLLIDNNGFSLGNVRDAAYNPISQANILSTRINPGLVLISGATTLSDWRAGGDNTKIEGGNIYANSITANKLRIGNRGVSVQDLNFQANAITNVCSWTEGYVLTTGDDGNPFAQHISAGNTGTWVGAYKYVAWQKGNNYLTVSDGFNSSVSGEDIVMMCVYQGGGAIGSPLGSTIIDGDRITTGTVTATQIAAGTITANEIATNAITASKILAGTITATQLAVGSITADKLTIGTGSNQFYNAAFSAPFDNSYFFISDNPIGCSIATGTGTGLTGDSYNWELTGGHTLAMHQFDGVTGGYVYGTFQRRIDTNTWSMYYPISAGKTYEFSMWTQEHRCRSVIDLLFLDNNYNVLAECVPVAGLKVTPPGGYAARILDAYGRQFMAATAPSGATFARLRLAKYGTDPGGGDSYVFMTQPFFGETVPNATQPTPWAPDGATIINGGSIVTGSITADKIYATSLGAISANIGTVTAGYLQNASNSTFLDLNNSRQQFAVGGYVLRQGSIGSGVIQWFGSSSVGIGSETRTNGVWSFGTDGVVYYGSSSLSAGNNAFAQQSSTGAGCSSTSWTDISSVTFSNIPAGGGFWTNLNAAFAQNGVSTSPSNSTGGMQGTIRIIERQSGQADIGIGTTATWDVHYNAGDGAWDGHDAYINGGIVASHYSGSVQLVVQVQKTGGSADSLGGMITGVGAAWLKAG